MSIGMELIKKGKISSTGATTLAVTIPSDQVEVLGLKKGDSFLMYKEGGRLIIEFPEVKGEKPEEF